MMFPIYSKSIIFACFAMLTYLLDHVHELSLRWVLSERSHDGTKFLGGDGTYMVEEGGVSLEMKRRFLLSDIRLPTPGCVQHEAIRNDLPSSAFVPVDLHDT